MMRFACISIVVLAACGGSTSSVEPDAALSDAAVVAVDAAADAPKAPPARLQVVGSQVRDPLGVPIILRGYNWGQWGTMQPQDAADNAAQGANLVRIPLRWWGEWKPGVDSYSQAAPGHIDPAHLTVLDDMIAKAAGQGLWIVLFVDSNYGQGANDRTDNFWTNAAKKQEFIEVWKFLLQRYAQQEKIAAWEIMPEPRPINASLDEVREFYESIIPPLRAFDPRTPFVIGPGDAYNLNKLASAYTTVDSNIIYTGDYFIFSNELARVPDIIDFRAAKNVPVWVNQIGIQSGDPDAELKARNLLSALKTNDVGWAWWTYRGQTLSPDQHGIYYQDADDNWIVKPVWLALLGSFLR